MLHLRLALPQLQALHFQCLFAAEYTLMLRAPQQADVEDDAAASWIQATNLSTSMPLLPRKKTHREISTAWRKSNLSHSGRSLLASLALA